MPGDAERVFRRLPEPVKPPPFVEPPHDSLRPVGGTLDDWHVATWYQPWWSQMPAFVLPSFADAHFRLNIAGRERDGMVEPGDYRRTRDELEAWIRSCRNARTGHSIVERVAYPRGDDPFESAGPDADLIVSFSEDAEALEHDDVGSVGPFPTGRTGTHTNKGFALFVGADIRAGERLEGHELVDLPATILALAGVEALHEIDGTPMASVLNQSVRQ
jgi:predicted AlkP superfamily phosphohydrolase/phosphomutase